MSCQPAVTFFGEETALPCIQNRVLQSKTRFFAFWTAIFRFSAVRKAVFPILDCRADSQGAFEARLGLPAATGSPRAGRLASGNTQLPSSRGASTPHRAELNRKGNPFGLPFCLHGGGFEPSTSTTSRWHSPAELAVHCITIMHDLWNLSSIWTKNLSNGCT